MSVHAGKKRKVISSFKLTKELLALGFNVIDVAPDRNKENGTVHIFHYTDELRKYLKEKKNEQYKNKPRNEKDILYINS